MKLAVTVENHDHAYVDKRLGQVEQMATRVVGSG
jgi:hypothetical protein